MATNKYEFPDCMHAFAAAFHMMGIDPQTVKIVMPRDKWWDLQCALDRKFGRFMVYDGRNTLHDEFQYMGFRFMVDR
jgi:hypothetical protein